MFIIIEYTYTVYLFFFIKFIGVTLVNKTIWVSSVNFYDT